MPADEEATISAVYGAYYSLLTDADGSQLGREYRGRLRGKMRLGRQAGGGQTRLPEHLQVRHPVMAGDRVVFRRIPGDDSVVDIREVLPRENALFRASGQKAHALGANLDRAVLVASLAQPEVNFRFVDRFLISCRAGGVPPVLVFSKLDLLEQDEDPDYKREVCRAYEQQGYTVILVDLLRGEPRPQVENLLELTNRGLTLLAGNSGTGKSTLLNLLSGKEEVRTADISQTTHKGRHTTTNPRLIARDAHSRLIDTPGVKEWGILHLDRRGIFAGFPELDDAAAQCPFSNCEHKPEDGSCQVQAFLDEAGADLESGLMHPERLVSLELMLESLLRPDRIRYGDYVKPTGRMRNQDD